jgi:fucose permease
MQRCRIAVLLVFLTMFVIPAMTPIPGSINPRITDDFGIDLFFGTLITISFFIACGVISIPAGMLRERFHGKPVLGISFALTFAAFSAFATKPGIALMLPPVVGLPGDLLGLRYAMTILFLTLASILFIGIWAKPLVGNATIHEVKRTDTQARQAG